MPHVSKIWEIWNAGIYANDGLMVTVSDDLCVIWEETSLAEVTWMSTPNSEVKIVTASLQMPDRVCVLFSNG